MRFASRVRQMIRELNEREQAIWKLCLTHSSQYMEVLGLNTADLDVLERLQDGAREEFFHFMLEGEAFSLAVWHVCGIPYPYGSPWTDGVVACCLSNPGLNLGVGGGTTRISVVPEAWHAMLLQYLAERHGDATPMRSKINEDRAIGCDLPGWQKDDAKRHPWSDHLAAVSGTWHHDAPCSCDGAADILHLSRDDAVVKAADEVPDYDPSIQEQLLKACGLGGKGGGRNVQKA